MRGSIPMTLLLALSGLSPARADRPAELGRIEWTRDFEAAREESSRTGRPIMLLFDEVPGCETCKLFGTGPLSHPIVVDASREFVRVAVYNNLGGGDAEVLKRFSEPSWNNPVVRFIDAEGRDLIPREQAYTTPVLVRRMRDALEAAGRDVPGYLDLVAAEYSPRDPRTAVFSMDCYWEGERQLGSIPGVTGTRIGMLDGREVVEVAYDGSVIGTDELVGAAADRGVTERMRSAGAAIDDSTPQQVDLARHPEYHHLPLTALQATRVNAALASGLSPEPYLSPGQISLSGRLSALAGTAGGIERLRRIPVDRSPEGMIVQDRALRMLLEESPRAK